MITKLRQRLSISKSNPLPDPKLSKNGNDNNDDDDEERPSFAAALSATLKNPSHLLDQDEVVHAILAGIQSTTRKQTQASAVDMSKSSSSELQQHCKTVTKVVCPQCGSDDSKPHSFNNFEFEAYAVEIFKSLRAHFGIASGTDAFEFLSKLCRHSQAATGKENDDEKSEDAKLGADVDVAEYTSFWKTLITNSKSGQLFYITQDSQFIIKSMSKSESMFLRQHLPEYYQYMLGNKDSLICQFLGLFKVNIQFQKSVFIMVQKSVLHSLPVKLRMHKLYDLKGSTFNRQATRWKVEVTEEDMEQISDTLRNQKVDEMVDAIEDIDLTKPCSAAQVFEDNFSPSFYVPDVEETPHIKHFKSNSVSASPRVKDASSPPNQNSGRKKSSPEEAASGSFFKRSKILKDLDFLKDKQGIIVGPKRKKLWLQQLEKDTKFLCSLNVMDYSLLLGMHFKEKNAENSGDAEMEQQRWTEGQLFRYECGGMSYHEEDDVDVVDADGDLEPSWSDENNLKPQLRQCLYFAGIIDILQPYNARKKVERLFLGLKTDADKVSAVDPELYSQRLVQLMKNAVH